MIHLQKHRPYAQVVGLGGGIVWQQDGRYFYGDGREAPDPETPPDAVSATPLPETSEESSEIAYTAPPISPPAEISKDDMRFKENKALKLQMENYGQEWQGVAHAKKYLGVE